MSTRYQLLIEQAKATTAEIEPSALRTRLEQPEGLYLIDVREDSEWQQGHLPQATHISRGTLEAKIEHLVSNPQAEIVLYCAAGGRSILAAQSLNQMGYKNVKSLIGGYQNWPYEIQ